MPARRLYELRPRRSPFVQLFRTTPPSTVCPNFYVLAHADGCAFAPHCEYCYLKSSLWHLRRPTVFTNIDHLLRDVRRWIRRNDLETWFLNAGNLSDSLAFERRRPLMRRLVALFREEACGRPHTLLLVTKGGPEECADLLSAEPCPNVIVSFSVNHAAAARRYEKGAAKVADRLRAATALRTAGWRVRIRIDPMIAGYRYGLLARQVCAVRPERVTLGTLRAEASLLRFASCEAFRRLEPPPSPRGLARYPLPLRLALYRPMVRAFRKVCTIGLCEETPEVWIKLGLDPTTASCNCGP